MSAKKPRLFYYEEANDAWNPVPTPQSFELVNEDSVYGILDVEQFSEDGEEIAIKFKRIDMTDEEFANLPED